MTNPLVKVSSAVDGQGNHLYGVWTWWCLGCEQATGHGYHAFHDDKWTFDGNLESPTFSPSYLTWHDEWSGPPNARVSTPYRCHSFIRAGQIQYLEDSTHPLAGKTIDMVPLPDWLLD